MRYRSLAFAAAALAAGFLSLGGAEAANLMTGAPAPMMPVQDGNIQQVQNNYWYHNHHHHNNGGSGIYLGLGLLPFVGGGYGYGSGYGYPYDGGYGYGYPYGYGSGYGYGGGYGYAPRARYARVGASAHVRYCMNRYRTYDPRSNTFIGYDGDSHRCRSPYRY